MAIERKFIEDAIARFKVSSFLKDRLERVGFSNVTIQRTPIVTRITVEVANPGRLIGKKGRSIKRLTDIISKEFGVPEPQIAVVPVEKIELEPRLMARAIAKRIEAGKPIRPTIHMALKRIMDAGAIGAEIVVKGKLVGKGGKARGMRAAAGYLPKAGEVKRLVKEANVEARPKQGKINVRVRITPPDAVFPDREVKKVELSKVYKYAIPAEKKAPVEKGATERESETNEKEGS